MRMSDVLAGTCLAGCMTNHLHLSVDLQGIENSGYDSDRSPVLIGAMRLHSQF